MQKTDPQTPDNTFLAATQDDLLPRKQSLSGLFEEQVKQRPDAIALQYEDQQLTYQELNERANQLAYYLQQQGVRLGERVGICMKRSLEMAIGVLGVLKAGGTYIPLDSLYPSERLHVMLEDARPLAVLTLQGVRGRLPTNSTLVMCLDTLWEHIAQQSKANVSLPIIPAAIAYIMYTSGSTGRPKGVMISHYAITNRLLWSQNETPLTPTDTILQLSSFSFDISVWELFGSWAAGARVVLVDPARQSDSVYLVHLMVQQHMTAICCVPSLLQILLETPGFEDCTSLREIYSGGEAVPATLPQRLQEQLHQPIIFYQFYGPTETSINATYWLYNDATLSSLPIGKPIANMQAYILDGTWQLAEPGMEGELCLSGDGLAYGYLDRPDVTATHFIPNPFSEHAGDRLYRTGDLARALPDGNLEFLGRLDHQVKVRGMRVELGEIETLLGHYPGVNEALAVVREDRPGDKRLVAYLVGQPPKGEKVEALRQHLRARLPQYMLPAAFIWLDAFPLTANGKVDRQALPVPQWEQMEVLTEEHIPQTLAELKLAEIWAEVLGVNRVSRQAHFFEQGGHSLLAVRLISRIRQHFQVDLPMQILFKTPILASLAQTLEQLSQNHLQPVKPRVSSRSHDGEIPLAYEQEQLWFLAQLEPTNPFYNISLILHLEGNLQISALEKSLNMLLERHESLRTSFSATDGRPYQVIAPAVKVPLPVLDLSDLAATPAVQQAAFTQASQQEADIPFDLEKPPLLRVRLIRFNSEQHCVLFTVHHLVFDGWSQSVFLRELAALYRAELEGTILALPPLAVQYADYAYWQQEWLQGEVLATELAYWQGEIMGAPTYLDLPTNHPRVSNPGFEGSTCSLMLSAALTRRLKTFALQHECSLFMLALAGLEIVLSRYSGQDDFLVGTPVSMRNQVETEGLIGMLANTLALRADVQGQSSGLKLIQRVRDRVLRAQAHAGLPLEQLVKVVQPERQGSLTPLIQVVFAWEEAPAAEQELASGLHLRVESGMSRVARFELTFFAWEAGEELNVLAEYNTALYRQETIQRLLEHWRQILEELTARPEQSIGRLRMLTEGEWQRQIADWNQTQQAFPYQQCVHELVETQALIRPQAPALRAAHQELTYQELNERANQLASYLRQQGVGVETRVGICLERSIDVIVGVLAILKAGGAYVPLDPVYPGERLTSMLTDAQVQLVLTQQSLSKLVPHITNIPLVCLDMLGEQLARQPVANMASRIQPQNLAYIIYTSGSTGQPKGVAVTHRNIVRLAYQPDYVQVSTSDVFLQLAPIAFDASTFEIWGSLLNGAQLVLAPAELPSLQELSQLIQQQHISILWLTAGFFHQMVELQLEGLRPVKHLLAGGEALSVPHVRQALDRLPQCQIINGYGPTENTTFSCCYAIQVEDALDPSVPIGKPISYTQAYVLDKQLQPVPVGVIGELYMGGEGLARGYLNRPELTAERFVPHPFSQESGARLYRSGDLVRARSDGTLLFIGRSDRQVKLRGYRIECGEIENWLVQHAAVNSAAVILREDLPADTCLVAYLVGQNPGEEVLREHLRKRVPEYMLPTAFVWLDALPLTPNGKVNQQALPPPQWEQVTALADEQLPQTCTEQVLAEMWAEVLGIRQVSRQAHFFERGGTLCWLSA